MAPPPPVLDKNKRVIPLLDPYTERALDQAYAEQYGTASLFLNIFLTFIKFTTK
ncbi:unnamed protein product [Onchocerca flexuosa]|uniref:Uncharacterized protein n=1 Tax=Onchocerca flexuosa TaxID=387005 RepID=A0A183I8P3_9BILA|nr:unnamed protein product [Onchocerca flexuosa]